VDKQKHSSVTLDLYSRCCLTAIAFLLTMLVVGLWADASYDTRPAGAAEPFLNTGAQREEIVIAQKETTQKIEELMNLLKSGDVKVRVIEEPSKPSGPSQVNQGEKPHVTPATK
jgi:hypothetical protein